MENKTHNTEIDAKSILEQMRDALSTAGSLLRQVAIQQKKYERLRNVYDQMEAQDAKHAKR